MAVALVLSVWLTKKTLKKDVRQLASQPCPMSDVFAFRVVDLEKVGEDSSSLMPVVVVRVGIIILI